MALTVVARRTAAYGGRGTAARYQQLILIAQVVSRLWWRYGEHIQVQPQLADVRMQLLHSHLAAARAVKHIRMIGIHKVRGIFAYHAAAGLKN